jgi:glycosyltransferase involved in cell wall biosynthesis
MIEEWFQERLATMIRHLVVGMIDSALKLTVVAPPGLEDAFFGPVRVVPFVEPSWLLARRAYARLFSQIESQPPDAAFLFGAISRAHRDVHRVFRCPIVRVVSSTEEVRDLSTAGVGSTAAVVALSLSLQDAVTRAVMTPAGRVHLIRPGLHVPATEPASSDEAAEAPAPPDAGIREGDEMSPEVEPPPVTPPPQTVLVRSPVMTAGGAVTVFEATRQILGDAPNVMIFVVGAGEEETRLRRECDRLGIRDRVIFAAAAESERIDPAGFDLFIQPDAEDEIGMTVLHAMGHGVAVLAPGAGNHDCLIDQKTALFYDPTSPKSLAARMKRLLEDREFATTLGAAGREHVQQYHQVSGMATAYVDLQASLAAP